MNIRMKRELRVPLAVGTAVLQANQTLIADEQPDLVRVALEKHKDAWEPVDRQSGAGGDAGDEPVEPRPGPDHADPDNAAEKAAEIQRRAAEDANAERERLAEKAAEAEADAVRKAQAEAEAEKAAREADAAKQAEAEKAVAAQDKSKSGKSKSGK